LNELNIVTHLKQELQGEGIQLKIIPISRWKEVRDEITQVLDGLTDPGILKYIKKYFDFDIEKSFQDPRSLLILSVPTWKVRFRFNYDGKEIEAIVPSAYMDFFRVKDKVDSILERSLGASGFKFEFLSIPAKLLAVRSGLARYGRNNIAYVEDAGSFIRFMIFASDLPVEDHEWHEKRKMDRCERCDLCLDNCPTGAIDSSRFLLRAERCLTYFNEWESDIPEWVEGSWHNCLIGCLRCQEVCPANKKVSRNVIEGDTFSGEETKVLMSTSKIEDLPSDLRKKVEDSGLSALYPVLPRNIDLLLGVRSDDSD
jgi:epoxyqueuosine reductase